MIFHKEYYYGIPIHVMSMDGQLLIRETLKLPLEIEFTRWTVKSSLGWTIGEVIYYLLQNTKS